MRLVFFGSGPVAADSLRLLARDFVIEAVVTKPRAPQHRGEVPVLAAADELKLPVFTTLGKQELDQLFKTKPFSSQLAVLIDFGIIVSQKVINYFPLGIINSHFSLLPQWRGADPITFAILSGQKQTGISLMLIVEKMDEGPLLAQSIYELPPKITAPELTDALIELSHQALLNVLPLYVAGKIQPASQEVASLTGSKTPTYSRKLIKQDGLMHWSKPAKHLEREVRAYLGWPKSRTKIFGRDVIITKTRIAKTANDGDLVIKCQPGWLEILRLKAPSGRTISGADFIRGYQK